MVRIGFESFGWGGPRLQITLDELKDEDDVLVESEGLKIVYSSMLERYVNNCIIDYSNRWFEHGFVIRGANVSSCWYSINIVRIIINIIRTMFM